MIPQIVGRTPRYDCGTGTIVLMAFRFDWDSGGDNDGDVHVAIWARRRTVSRGSLIDKSRADPKRVKMDQLAGLITGSMPKYVLRTKGVDVETNMGTEELKNVIGTR